jgi:hypothetical protein
MGVGTLDENVVAARASADARTTIGCSQGGLGSPLGTAAPSFQSCSVFSCRVRRLGSMKTASPLDKGDFRGVLVVTCNLVWVVARGTHPGASRPRGVFSRLHLRATPPTEGIFKGSHLSC